MSRSAAIFLAMVMVFAASLSAAVFEQEPLLEHQYIRKTVVFPDGQRWGMTTGSSPAALLVRENGRWVSVDISPQKFRMKSLNQTLNAAAGKGDVLWILATDDGGKFFVAQWNRRTRRSDSTVPLPFENANYTAIQLHPAPDGSLWVTADDPRVFRLAGGQWREVFRVTEAMTVKSPSAEKKREWSALDVLFAADGAAWVWTNHGTRDEGTMRGLARVRDGKSQWFESIEGLPAGMLLMMKLVTVSGRQELWATVMREGTFRIQLDSLSAAQLEFPEDTKKNPVWEVFAGGGEIWAVNQHGIFDPAITEDAGGVLWRLSNSGAWEKKASGFDRARVWEVHQNGRAWCSTPQGLWFAGRGTGLWFAPADGGAAVNLGWEKNFPLFNPADIAVEPDGRLAVVEETGAYHFDPARALALTVSGTDAVRAAFGADLTRARDGALFSHNRFARSLRQWTREGWRDIPYGDELGIVAGKYEPEAGLGADSRNRVWLIPDDADRDLARVWNMDTQSWDAPRPYMELIAEAAAAKPDWHFLFNISDVKKLHHRREAVFDRRGRAAFIGSGRLLWAFDGREWQRLTPKNFPAVKNAWFEELQNAAADGDILLRVNDETWCRWDADGQWSALDQQRAPARREPMGAAVVRGKHPQQTEEWQCLDVSGFVTADGEEWAVADEKLYRRRYGWLVAWLDGEQSSPFIGVKPEGVLTDAFGRRVFYNFRELVAVRDHPPAENFAPQPADVEVTNPAHDAARLSFSGAFADGDTLRWRRADTAWGAWGRDTTLVLSELPLGDYVVEIQKMDRWLNVSPAAAVKFNIKYDADKIAREAVEKLFGKNWEERNAAMKTLARFPEQARAALQKIAADRQRLGDSDRWWLDAALEQVGGR